MAVEYRDHENVNATTEIRQFVAGLTHHIANQFVSLTMNADLGRVHAERNDGPRAVQSFDRILADFSRVRKMLAELRHFSDALSPPTQTRPLRKTIDAAMAAARDVLPAGPVEINADVTALAADLAVPMNCETIFSEIIVNAAQAGADKVSIVVSSDNSQVTVVISDNGSGIAENARAQIFNAFFTTRSRSEHAGLGLTVARYLSLGMGGSVQVLKSDAEGTQIEITFDITN